MGVIESLFLLFFFCFLWSDLTWTELRIILQMGPSPKQNQPSQLYGWHLLQRLAGLTGPPRKESGRRFASVARGPWLQPLLSPGKSVDGVPVELGSTLHPAALCPSSFLLGCRGCLERDACESRSATASSPQSQGTVLTCVHVSVGCGTDTFSPQGVRY